jgi:hypothetical protein
MMNLTALAEQYRRFREDLLREHPELVDDGETLADTLEGIADLPDVLAAFIRNARRDEAMASGLAELIEGETSRKARLLARAAKRRHIVHALMESVEMGKLEQPDFTASIRSVPPKVEITDEAALPDSYVRVVRSPDKTAIKDALKRGEPVPGAVLGNGSTTLTVTTR